MLSVDTNVVVRLFARDDPAQTSAVAALLAGQQIWIAKTVLLETEWILRSVYGFDAASVRGALHSLLSLQNAEVEDRQAVITAIDLAAQGLELADAIHLSSRPANAHFVTFDKALIRAARRAGVSHITEVPQP